MKKIFALLLLSISAVLCVGIGCTPNNSEGGKRPYSRLF